MTVLAAAAHSSHTDSRNWTIDTNGDQPAKLDRPLDWLEIPTPRWIVCDALRFGVEIPEGAETTHQERAHTAPIWYTP